MTQGFAADEFTLFEEHRTFLNSCAISDEVIHGRGYYSLTDPAREHLANEWTIPRAQLSTSGLVIPRYTAHGEATYPQVRYEVPFIINGESRKYNCPAGSGGVLDVHPSVRDRIQDPDVPLLLVESIKGADAVNSLGGVAIGFHGVWGWKSNNAPSLEFRKIPLDTREIAICFDTDVHHRELLQKALKELVGFLRYEKAVVWIAEIPPSAGDKAGVDDHLASYLEAQRTVG
jgi:hypothetical protein